MIDRGRRVAAVWVVIVASGAACGLVACGGGPSEEDRVKEAVVDLQRAYLAGNLPAVCESMTAQAKYQAGSAAHETPTSCRRDMKRLREMLESDRAPGYPRRPTVTGVTIDGSRAVADATFGSDVTTRIELKRKNGGWALDNFFGASVEREKLMTPPAEPPTTKMVALDASGNECPPVHPAGPVIQGIPTKLRGGCKITARHDGEIVFGMRTAFGMFEFGRCDMKFVLRVESDGQVWVDELVTSGALACNDVALCRDGFVPRPWLGQLDGRNRLRLNACFWTCIGDFQEALVLRLTPGDKTWRLDGTGIVMGASNGWEMDGRWRLDAGGVELRPA